MFKIDLKNRKPIYEQVMDNFKKLIIAGTLTAESKVPSIRDMAKTLSVNPNTVQRAYRELEAQGYIYTVIGQGSFIATPPESARKKEVEALYVILGNQANELIYRGETKDNIHQYIDELPNPNSEAEASPAERRGGGGSAPIEEEEKNND